MRPLSILFRGERYTSIFFPSQIAISNLFKNREIGAGETTQLLRTHDALAGDLDLAAKRMSRNSHIPVIPVAERLTCSYGLHAYLYTCGAQ